LNSASNSALFLSYATAIATFSAAAVALGLLYCVSLFQRIAAILILLLALLGIASSLIAVAKQHSLLVLNVLIAVGFITTGGYVLYAALSVIFTAPNAHDRDQHGYWLWLHKRGGVERNQVYMAFTACVVIIICLFVVATPGLLDSLANPQRAEPASGSSSSTMTYDDFCGGRQNGLDRALKTPLGWPAPNPQKRRLGELWLGSSGAGVLQAGCPLYARNISSGHELWLMEGVSQGKLRSVGLADRDGNSTLLFGQAAHFVIDQARDGLLVSAVGPIGVRSGDMYLVDTMHGTTVLVRSRKIQGGASVAEQGHLFISPRKSRYAVVPPALVKLWTRLMQSTGWIWPRRFARHGEQRVHFVFFASGRQHKVVATAICEDINDCILMKNGQAVRSVGKFRILPAELLALQ